MLPTQRIQVPANLGFTRLSRGSHTRIGFIDVTWFEGRVLQLVGQLHLDPTTLPIFLSDTAFLPWFEQVAPSTSVNGYYSFLNTLPDLSPCN